MSYQQIMPYFAIFSYAPFWFDDFFKVVKLMATHMRSYISCLMWCKFFEARVLKWMLKTRIQLNWFYHLVLFWLVSDINFRHNSMSCTVEKRIQKEIGCILRILWRYFPFIATLEYFWTRSFCWQLRVIKYLWQLLHPLCFTILYMLLF